MKPFIVLDTRHLLTEGPNAGRYHVKIKASIPIIVNGKKKFMPRRALTDVYATPEEFTVMMGKRMGKELQAKKDIVDQKLLKAQTVCKIKGLTPDRYIQLVDSSGSFENVVGMFDYYIGECLKEDPETGEARDGNAIALEDAKRFFCRFKASDHISYAEVTKEWLDDCKRWALKEEVDATVKVIKRKVSLATFFMYCRALRTIMNLAVDFGKITDDESPFGKGKSKFKIPSSKKKKRKIKLELPLEVLIEQKNKILTHVSARPKVNKALNYWKASYFGNGSNMADVLRWKFKDYDVIHGEIKFERKKTANTQEENEVITVLVGEDLREIIIIEGNEPGDPEEYIFPVLNNSMNSAERKQAVMAFIDFMNKRLKTARKEMNLQIKITSSSSRYLSSTILDRSGIPKSIIKEALGHESEDMQEHYVSPYLIDIRKKMLEILKAS